ncbi:hypothetical protein PAXINDRAFT_20160 [Paxillus involutus ATCC 200175]|uniref:Uncharacterized protein n=1 Tax=Paxillus involutus ATCC 200175 TaxID=664439 RepID=A0A0C9TET4_PAXIN|nr:hypothetical protein PAXINDRAFT_20160 [Paxillus involutus ATCC 200175]
MADFDEVLDIPELTVDGRNWTTYRDAILHESKYEGLTGHYDGTQTPPVHESGRSEWCKRDGRAKQLLATTIPDDILYKLGPKSLFENSAHHFFSQLRILFEKSKPTTMTTATTTHERKPDGQGKVGRRKEEGEKGRRSSGRADEKVTTATSPGKGATDHRAGSISLVKPTSSQENIPGTHVDTPSPPPPTPNLPVEQTAPMSTRPTHQRSRNGHVPRNGTRRTRGDNVKGSRGRAESRSRGGREPDDEDGDNVDVDHAHVVPQHPESTCQTAYEEAADPSNPNARAGPTEPAGTSNRPPNGSSEVEGEGGKGEGNERASGIVDPSSNGENAIPDSIPPTPHLDERGPPPSMPLEGEKNGQQLSGHGDETGTHQVETPQHKSTTQQPRRTPYNQRSNGEDRGVAVGHREAAGARDEVRERDEAGGDEEGQENREEDEEDAPSEPLPPNHPPAPAPTPIHPERPDDVDTVRTCKTAARRRADAVHDPGGETRAPDSTPPSVRLEGESSKRSSRHVEPNDVETDDHNAQTTPRDPVGTQDGDTRPPNEPTEPPDKEEGADGGNGELRVKGVERSTVERDETNASSRTDKPGDEEVEESRSRGVEGETGGQSEDNGCQRDGRTCNTGGATSSASHDSKRVGTGLLAEDEEGQQRHDIRNTSTNSPGPPVPSTKRPKRDVDRSTNVGPY